MLQTKKLEIYPTSRAIREQLLGSLSQDRLLPKTITIGEFEKKALLVPNRTFVDEDTKILLMQEASNFANFKALNIDREFFTFLKNSKYLFSFFEELAVELVDIETLKTFDTYASYNEHLEILQTLQQKYIQLLDEKNYVDKMTLPSLYRLNQKYIKSFEQIDLYLEGYLNRFELKLFTEVARLTPLIIHIHTNRFNQKMIDAFSTFFSLTLKEDHYYMLDMQKQSILTEEKIPEPATEYIIDAQESRIDQIAFIKQKIYDFTHKGFPPEEIVVILPKSSSAELLDLFDEENNFNFAMGFAFSKTQIYKKLDALYQYYMEKNHENYYRIRALGFSSEKAEKLQENWSKRVDHKTILNIFKTIIPEEENDAYKLYESELTLFGKLIPTLAHYPFHKILHLFLNRLAKLSLDDTRGGKVTVLEILETRGIQKEALIVIDFNEGILPSVSRKDLFLSSSIRKSCHLPTPSDRENLQKYYYKRIFDQAKEVAICYVQDEQNQPSRFLEELSIQDNHSTHGDLKHILFPFHTYKPHFILDDLILSYDFTKTGLSASSLKSFLNCKRQYYFKYIAKIEDFEIPKDLNDERIIGNILHDALKSLYQRQNSYLDQEALLLDLQKELYIRSEHSPSLRFLIDIWLEKLKPFIKKEVERFHEGFEVYMTEKKFTTVYEHLPLNGNIDRIDKQENDYYILDYKSGKIPKTTSKSLEKTTDFQLQFYYLITQDLGNVADALYYDLNSASLISEDLFDEKLDLLYTHFETLQAKEFNFTMTEDLKKCQYCPYQKICDRIL